jgi:hypothetical protein
MLDQLREALAVERPSLNGDRSDSEVNGSAGPTRAFGMDELEAACLAARRSGHGEGYRLAWETGTRRAEQQAHSWRVNGETTGVLGALRHVLSVLEDSRPKTPGPKAPRFEQGEAAGQRELIDELVDSFGRLAQQVQREGSNGERQARMTGGAADFLARHLGDRP